MKTSFHSPTGWGFPSVAPYAPFARAAGPLLLAFVCACNFGGSDEDGGTLDIDFDADSDARPPGSTRAAAAAPGTPPMRSK